jgi:hypothetical protein
MLKDKGNGGPFRALQKRVAGKFTTLKSDKWEYEQNTWYEVRVKVSGSNIKVYMDDDLVFDVTDDSLPLGKIALFTWGMGNPAAHFDDVVVRGSAVPPEWKVIRGDWDISPDRILQKSLRGYGLLDGAILINTKYLDLRRFSIEADGMVTDKARYGLWGFVYGFKDEKNFNALYCRGHKKQWVAWSTVDGEATKEHRMPFKISAYEFHHLRVDIDYDAHRYEVFVDGEKIGSMPEAQVRHEGGKVGLIAWDPAEFRNVKITILRAALLDLSQASEAWAREWKVLSTSENFAGGGKPGFYLEAVRSGDANPNRGRTGILYLHPPTQQKPATIARSVTLTGPAPTLRMGVSGNRDVDGDWALLVKVNGEPLEEEKIIAGAQGWQDLTFDLSDYSGQTVSIEIEARANDWHYEYAFLDYIQIEEEKVPHKDAFRLSTGEMIFGELLSFDGSTFRIKTEKGILEKRREEITTILLGVAQ